MVDAKTTLSQHMVTVEELLNQTFTDHVLETSVNAMCQHVVKAGGKRMRPQLALLSALALPQFDPQEHLKRICHIAASIELLHAATLVHDDVIDKAPLRRGVVTLNEKDGNHAAVLAGDYLFSRSFSLMHDVRDFDLLQALNNTLRNLVVGELYQLEHEGESSISIELYQKTIYAKTGVLFEYACSAPLYILRNHFELLENFKSFGRNLGVAFQIKDDMLDYSSNASELGKDAGADLADKRITLPVILALQNSSAQEEQQLLQDIEQVNLDGVKAAIIRTNALTKCHEMASQVANEAIKALDVLPTSPYKEMLIEFCHKAIERKA